MTVPPYFPVVATSTLLLTAISGFMAMLAPEDAEAYSFKAFLIVCVIALSGVILVGFKLWYRDMRVNQDELKEALQNNTTAFQRFIELFDSIGVEALLKNLRSGGSIEKHSLQEFLKEQESKFKSVKPKKP